MSYEGYEQHICENGHYYNSDCYDHDAICPICGGKSAWYNSVDQTNGPSMGEVLMTDLESFIIKPVEHCKCCGQVTNKPIYRVPTKEENKNIPRQYPEEED